MLGCNSGSWSSSVWMIFRKLSKKNRFTDTKSFQLGWAFYENCFISKLCHLKYPINLHCKPSLRLCSKIKRAGLKLKLNQVGLGKMKVKPPKHIYWSTDTYDKLLWIFRAFTHFHTRSNAVEENHPVWVFFNQIPHLYYFSSLQSLLHWVKSYFNYTELCRSLLLLSFMRFPPFLSSEGRGNERKYKLNTPMALCLMCLRFVFSLLSPKCWKLHIKALQTKFSMQ